MMTVMVILCLVVFILLVAVSGIAPRRSSLSRFELERRQSEGDRRAVAELHREALMVNIISFQRILTALLLVIFVLFSVVALGWLVGIIVAVIVALEYASIGRLEFVQKRSQKLYDQYEPVILRFIEKISPILRFMRSASPERSENRIDSREELVHLVDTSGAILSDNEKKLITHSLKFNERIVSEIMTPRGVIDSINKKEMLGPLVLDDLHKTGHSRFPVTDNDIDHVVGMLHIHDLLTIDSKRKSTTVERAMEPRVFYIHQEQTLAHALAAFLRTRHHLFIVVNEFRETVGLLSLEDVIEALLGRKIVDEFDLHDDLRAVAKRNPRGNNQPPAPIDV
ncbi:MAG TPA: CBS domain-containing protein [Candidatus Saccharimonadales bacterium]|nr:CBS domain-containing protein [Candidatus Saccharimonadales bacterium]